MPFFQFLEIGTSDFDSECQRYVKSAPPPEDFSGPPVGLSVEPLDFYLQRLPSHPAVLKANLAVSNCCGTTTVYHVPPEKIKAYKLPNWARGCNSIGQPHPTILRLLGGQAELFAQTEIELVDIATLFARYQVEGIDFLKIDTEGHDCVILESYLQYLAEHPEHPPARTIKFESNVLSSADQVTETIERLKKVGYALVFRNQDTLMKYCPPTTL